MATTAARRVHSTERRDIESMLRGRVSGDVKFDPATRVLYSTDASIYQMEPVGVVIPRNVEDVLAVIEVANQTGVPVLPRAGGTSLAGGEGKVLGTLIGAFIIAVIQNGMNLTGVESYTQRVVLGMVILGAVLIDTI